MILSLIFSSHRSKRPNQFFLFSIGFMNKAKQDNIDDIMKGTVQNALRKTFSPEFLNRLDDVIIFNSLGKEDIHKIIDISLGKLYKRIESLGYKLELTDKAKDFVAEKGYDPKYGARPLNRAIQKYLEDPIAEEILRADLVAGDVLEITHEEDQEKLMFKARQSGEKPKPEVEEPEEPQSKSTDE